MNLPVKDIKGNSQGELEVKIPLIENGKGTQAVHDVIVAYNAAQRSGTACTKTAGEVNGTNKKPWRQKGTGRARAGSFQSPLWRGGGVVFGPRPRDFSKKVSLATRKLAMRKALSERIKSNDVVVLDDIKLQTPKTQDFLAILEKLQLDDVTLLIVSGATDKNLTLASRNVLHVELATGENLNTYQVLRSDKIIFTRSAFEALEKRFIKE